MNDNSKKGNTVLLTVIAVATLLVAVVGATFAYFTASVTGNNTASSIIVKTAEIGNITYKTGNEIKMENALPGDTKNLTFTITASNSSTSNIPYAIGWKNVSNTFTNSSKDLVYTLSHTGENVGTYVTVTNEQPCPTKEGLIGDASHQAGSLPAGKTHSYTLTVTFKETYSDQNSDQGKHFYGKLEVTTGGSAGTLYYNSANSTGTATKPSSAAS